MLPTGARAILDARLKGQRPADQLVVSFVGRVPWNNPSVFADARREYDWRFLRGLAVMVVVRPGIAVKPALALIFAEAKLYPTLVDVENENIASIIDDRPLKLWPMTRRHEGWKALFA